MCMFLSYAHNLISCWQNLLSCVLTFKPSSECLSLFLQEIAEPLFHLKLAMEQLSASKTFRCILATVLAIGNFLNGCKVSVQIPFFTKHLFFCILYANFAFGRTKARGFELSYLGKLSQVRDTHTRQPLLHHVCVLLMQLYPQTSDLYSDITAVTKAGKVCSLA